jgi:hypothetical protein
MEMEKGKRCEVEGSEIENKPGRRGRRLTIAYERWVA